MRSALANNWTEEYSNRSDGINEGWKNRSNFTEIAREFELPKV